MNFMVEDIAASAVFQYVSITIGNSLSLTGEFLRSFWVISLYHIHAYQMFSFFYGKDTLDRLNIRSIDANEITLKPELLAR